MNEHNCYQSSGADYHIVKSPDFGWMIFFNDEYNHSIKYCPACGKELNYNE